MSACWETRCKNILTGASAVDFKDMPVSLLRRVSLLACILKSEERLYLFYQKNIGLSNPFFQEAAALSKLWWWEDSQVYKGISDQNTSNSWISGAGGTQEAHSNPATLPFLDSFSLELVCCAQTHIPWHRNLHPVFRYPSGVQPACSLLAARLSLTASPPGKRDKAESGNREKAEQRHVSGGAITPHHRGWSAHLVWVLPETLCNSNVWKDYYFIIPILIFDHFNHFVYSRQLPVSFMLHAFRLSVGGHNRKKTKAMSRGWCAWKRIISIYTFFSWMYLFRVGTRDVESKTGGYI